MIDISRWSGTYRQLKHLLPADDPRVLDAHRALITARLAHRASELMTDAAPLTDEQIERIVAVLRGQ